MSRSNDVQTQRIGTNQTHGPLSLSIGGTMDEPQCSNNIDSLQDRITELENRLRDIGNIAHAQSTGPAEPDWLWHIRKLAYELL